MNIWVGRNELCEKVLVIDDDVGLHRLIYEHIKMRGGDVDNIVFVSTGEDGVEKYIDIHPKCVFIDAKLHGMSGSGVFDLIKAFDPQARAIIMTGFPAGVEVVTMIENGAVAYLCKGCDEYLSLIADLIISVMDND